MLLFHFHLIFVCKDNVIKSFFTYFWSHCRLCIACSIWFVSRDDWTGLLRSDFRTCIGSSNFRWASACVTNIFLLYLGGFDSSWFIYNVGALWNMFLSHFWGVFSTTILALNIMIIISSWWWWKVCQIPSLLLVCF